VPIVISDLSLRNPFVYVLPEASLLEAVQFFAQGIHRIAVMNLDLSLKGILSQSALVTYIAEHLAELEDLTLKTLEDLQMTRKECVLSIDKSDLVLNGMITMHKNGVSSIAIVDHQFKMVGTISLSDIRFIVKKKMFAALWKSCHEFISYVRYQQGLEYHKGKDFLPVFHIPAKSTLEYTLKKLASVDAHRLWVLDEEDHPISVITLTDIFHLLNPTFKETSYIG